MFGVFVNVLTVLVGSSCGLLFRKALPRSISDKVMVALGLCTVFLGVDGMIDPDYGGALPLIIIVAMVLGTFVGALLRIDDGISRLGTWVEGKFSRAQKGTVAQGFVTASLVFCVGSMTVVGSLQAGLEGDYTLLLTSSPPPCWPLLWGSGFCSPPCSYWCFREAWCFCRGCFSPF